MKICTIYGEWQLILILPARALGDTRSPSPPIEDLRQVLQLRDVDRRVSGPLSAKEEWEEPECARLWTRAEPGKPSPRQRRACRAVPNPRDASQRRRDQRPPRLELQLRASDGLRSASGEEVLGLHQRSKSLPCRCLQTLTCYNQANLGLGGAHPRGLLWGYVVVGSGRMLLETSCVPFAVPDTSLPAWRWLLLHVPVTACSSGSSCSLHVLCQSSCALATGTCSPNCRLAASSFKLFPTCT